MQLGVFSVQTEYTIDIAVLARRAEEMGFESIWVAEHPIIPEKTTCPYPGSANGEIPDAAFRITDPFIALARASAVTEKLKLGTAICLVPEHNPLHLAKRVATLDMYSKGRFLFGIGAGWNKEETEIMGGDFEHRWTQTRESIEAMKELWGTEESEFHGKHYDFPAVYSFPKPARKPHPPIHLGGVAANVFKRVVAWGDGWMPYRITPVEVERGRQKLHELATDAGRDPASIEVTVFTPPSGIDLMKRYEDAGADRLLVELRETGEDETLAVLEGVLRKVRG